MTLFQVFILQERDKCIAELKANNIDCRPLIAGSLTRSPMWKNFGGLEVNNPNAETVHEYGFYVPNHQGISDKEVEQICNIIKKY